MQATVVQYWHKLHSLQVHPKFFKMMQMNMVIIFLNATIIIFE
jgi:hypothetical protein